MRDSGCSRHRLGAAAAALALCLVAQPVAAQVLEIGPNGAVITHDGPAVFSDTGVLPLVQPRATAPPKPGGPPPALAPALASAAERHGLSPHLVEAVAWQESRFQVNAVSPKGARGLMQLMPATARALGVDPADPVQNLDGGANYLAAMLNRFDGDLPLALAAYNAGPQAVVRHGDVPPFPETRAYVASVLERLALTSAHADGQQP